MSPTDEEPSADEGTAPANEPQVDDPDSPGLAATKPLDDPSRGDAEPNEPA